MSEKEMASIISRVAKATRYYLGKSASLPYELGIDIEGIERAQYYNVLDPDGISDLDVMSTKCRLQALEKCARCNMDYTYRGVIVLHVRGKIYTLCLGSEFIGKDGTWYYIEESKIPSHPFADLVQTREILYSPPMLPY